MQRLSSWFEQLPLRRRSSQRRAETRNAVKQSKSAAPRLRYSVSAAQHCRYRDHSADAYAQQFANADSLHGRVPPSWNGQEAAAHACSTPAQPMYASSLSQSFSATYANSRMKIRTNPWISRDRPSIRAIASHTPKPPNELLYASVDRCSSLRVKSLDESTCSSGYGSQDSSPESSVHSPDWQPSVKVTKRGHLEDKAVDCRSIDVDEALGLDIDDDEDDDEGDDFKPIGDSIADDDDEHVYHELEALNRFSVLLNENGACSSDSELAFSPSSSVHSGRASPIYAQPFPLIRGGGRAGGYAAADDDDDYPNTAASFTYIPCGSYRPAPQFHAPPPPPPPPPLTHPQSDFEKAELDFLAELDAQIAELQEKSEAVRQLVDEARERRDARARNTQLCSEQLAELRRLKWVMHDHFELVL